MEETKSKTKKSKVGIFIPLMVLALIGGSFTIGRLSAQVEYLSKGGSNAAGTVAQPQAGAPGETDLSAAGLKKLAKEVGLDTDSFGKCLDDAKYAQKVSDDASYGTSLGVTGTPSFFINGVMLVGAQPQAEFEKIIDAELKDGSGDKIAAATRKEVKNGVGPVLGKADAKVKIVEFSDFQCPYCKAAFPTIKAVLAKYGDSVSLEYRQFPLYNIHPNADRAAQASECALEQGKFWELHDKMFEGN